MKIVAQNRRARFDYEITDRIEAGIRLTGAEVKSCRLGHASLMGSYVTLRGGVPVLKGMSIAPYAYAFDPSYMPVRDRELLIHGKEQEKLKEIEATKGMTIIPLEIRAGRFIKVLLGIGRGRKNIDKRERIRERDVQRRMRRGAQE
jgi:SsrA-binding protein